MNKIKFRGKSIETNEWVYGQLLYFGNQPFIVGELVEANDEYTNLEWWQPVYHNSVGQFTGLKDKSGKAIYEGCIIEAYVFDADNKSKNIGKVAYNKDRHGFVFIPFSLESKGLWYPLHSVVTCSHIGNIYENPELVKEESE